MKKRLALLFTLLLLFPTNGWTAVENFSTGWTETDPNSRLSRTATRSTWTAVTHNESAYVKRNSAVNFTGDWDIAFDFYINSASTNNPTCWLDAPVLYDTGSDYIASVMMADYDGSKIVIGIDAVDDVQDEYEEAININTLNVNTLYYARWRRDGANGILYLDVYASDANRIAGSGALVSLTLPITVYGEIDFVRITCPDLYDVDDIGTHTGYLENLDLAYVPTPPTITNKPQVIHVQQFFSKLWNEITRLIVV